MKITVIAASMAAIFGIISGGLVVWSQIDETFDLSTDDYYVEFQRHTGEQPEAHTFEHTTLGMITVAHYVSDGCLLLYAPGRVPKFVPRREIDEAISPLASLNNSINLAGFSEPSNYSCLSRGCIDPHPGQFNTWHGDKIFSNGHQWVEVWRQFSDGCTHFQMLREDGYWDSFSNGAPRVCWVECIH